MGEILWDVFPGKRKPGGAPLNVALHLSRLDHDVRLLSRVGKDKMGKRLLRYISQNGLPTDLIQLDPELPTCEVSVSLDENSNASFIIPQPVAWDYLAYSPKLGELSKTAGVIIYGTLGSRHDAARNTIIRMLDSPALKVIDVNLRPPHTTPPVVRDLLSRADVAKLNEEELIAVSKWEGHQAEQTEDLMIWLANHYQLKMVVVTRGERGAILYDLKDFHGHSGYKVHVKDTVGAGDAFLAGFISSLLKDKKAAEAVSFACAAGAFVASREGATPAYHIEDITYTIQ